MTDPKDPIHNETDEQEADDEIQADNLASAPDDDDDDESEEEEIFTNRPLVDRDDDDNDDDEEESDDNSEELEASPETAELEADEVQEPQAKRPEVRMRPKTVEELLMQAVPQRARSAGDKLKLHLTGKTLISIKNTTDRYLLDWSGPEMITSKASSDDADCKITLSESDLMKISTGDLNPQILMLSHKVNVAGKADHAIYVFNLIAPHSSL